MSDRGTAISPCGWVCLIAVTCYFKNFQTLRSSVHHTDLNQMKIPSKSIKASREQRSTFALIRILISYWNTISDCALQQTSRFSHYKVDLVEKFGRHCHEWQQRKEKNGCKICIWLKYRYMENRPWRLAFGPLCIHFILNVIGIRIEFS